MKTENVIEVIIKISNNVKYSKIRLRAGNIIK